MASNTSYSDPRFGLVRRVVVSTQDDAGATGQHSEGISVPAKTKIVKFGVIGASDIVCSTTTTFTLETEGGTDLATFVPGDTTLATGEASGKTITATTVPSNQAVFGNVTEAGVSGKFSWYVDIQENYQSA